MLSMSDLHEDEVQELNETYSKGFRLSTTDELPASAVSRMFRSTRRVVRGVQEFDHNLPLGYGPVSITIYQIVP